MADTVLDIITDALIEIEAYGADEPVISAPDAQRGLRILNRELDAWAARKAYVYAVTFPTYTLTPGHFPHLIGPGLTAPDFEAVQRPVRVEGANLILNTSNPSVDTPIAIRDEAWWLNQRIKTLQSTVPTDLYYAAAWPNGELNLWPVPNFAYGLRLELWALISQFATINLAFSLPPGYRKAIVLTLAVRCCRAWGRPLRPDLVEDARQARSDIQTNNIKSPRIASADYGTAGSSQGRRGSFNYYSGQ